MPAGWEDEGGASGSRWPTVDGGRGHHQVAALTHLGRSDDGRNTGSVSDVASSDSIAADRAARHWPSRIRRCRSDTPRAMKPT